MFARWTGNHNFGNFAAVPKCHICWNYTLIMKNQKWIIKIDS